MQITNKNLRIKAEELADLVTEKNKAYGNSFEKCTEFLAVLWPNGVPKESYTDMLTIVRIFDKFMRLAHNKKAFDESPWDDIHGYSLLSSTLNDKREKQSEQPDNYDSKLSENSRYWTQKIEELMEQSHRDHREARWKSVPIREAKRASSCKEQRSALGSGETRKDVCKCSGSCEQDSETSSR